MCACVYFDSDRLERTVGELVAMVCCDWGEEEELSVQSLLACSPTMPFMKPSLASWLMVCC